MNMARIRGWIVLAMDVFTIFACNILIFLPAYLRNDIRLLNLILHIGFLTACVLVFQVVFRTYESLWRYAESREYLCLLSGLTAGYVLYAVLNVLLGAQSVWIASAFFGTVIALVVMLAYRFAYRLFRFRRAGMQNKGQRQGGHHRHRHRRRVPALRADAQHRRELRPLLPAGRRPRQDRKGGPGRAGERPHQ